MKKIKFQLVPLFVLTIFILLLGCAHKNTPKKIESGKLYTAYNLWYLKDNVSNTVNYQVGSLLPAGTEVKNVRIKYKYGDASNPEDFNDSTHIRFTTVNDAQHYKVQYERKYHRKRNLKHYLDLMFSGKQFDELTEGMNESELTAINNGKVVKGMSKRAVIVSVGVPSEKWTPKLACNKWAYWKNRLVKKDVCFDADNKATDCSNVKSKVCDGPADDAGSKSGDALM
jgi:hypothetical protein